MGQLVSYFKIPLNQVVVVNVYSSVTVFHNRSLQMSLAKSLLSNFHSLQMYDDLDLPFAKLRLLPKGGHGGHNGYSISHRPFWYLFHV